MKILVTGGAGFIGSHLVERLLSEGHGVAVLDNFATGHRRNLGALLDDVDLHEGDIRSYERVATAVRGCDAVLHQAALPSVPRSIQDPLTSTEVNVNGTLNLLLASRDAGVERVVCASSSSIYGANRDLPKRESAPVAPMSPYAAAKLAGESYCRACAEVYGLHTVALRYFNVFGPRQDPLSQYAAVIPAFITAHLRRERPTIFGDGEQSRDFTYVENVVEANLLALTNDAPAGSAMNVACGERISLNQLSDELNRLLGTGIEPVYEAERPGDVRHSQADIQRARELLGYTPVVDFAEGLRRTIEFYESAAVAEPLPAR
jgi:UDP-N-acetylglucosamine/UDP-N-acetyl-alpha-D-glucosaminouronate 4-epimerase